MCSLRSARLHFLLDWLYTIQAIDPVANGKDALRFFLSGARGRVPEANHPQPSLIRMEIVMSDALKVYVGYDSREDIAWQVCRHSLLRHASGPVPVYPLKQSTLRELGLYNRIDSKASTEFSITRFLTPWLAGHDGLAIFVDCDFLFTADLFRILDEIDRDKAVHVVRHEYTPANSVKMDGQKQTLYPRKNWSSFMLFDCAHPAVKALTPAVVNSATPLHLHRFEWVDDADIGALDVKWNFLEGEYERPADIPAAIHYTNGGPWFANWQDVMFADLWTAERDLYFASVERVAAELADYGNPRDPAVLSL